MTDRSVLFFGDINVDNILVVDELPEQGRDAYAQNLSMHLGGAVCNSAIILNGLKQSASLVGAIGTDLWAEFIFDTLKQSGINYENVVVKSQHPTGVIFIAVTPDGERTMFSFRGANTAIEPADIPENILDDIAMVQLSGYAILESPQRDSAWRMIHLAHDNGIPISLDTGLDPVIYGLAEVKKILPYLTLLITAEQEAALLTEETEELAQIESLLSFGIQQVGLKLGSQGALVANSTGLFKMPAFLVKVVDSTSAGDAFSAGLIYAYLNGFSSTASLVIANALGAMATTVYGAARLDRNDLKKFLDENLSTNFGLNIKNEIQEILTKLS